MQQLYPLIQKPFYQCIFFILASIVALLVIRPKTADNFWTLTGIIYGLFILVNSLLYFSAENTWPYFFISLAVSVLYLIVISIITPPLINVLKAKGSGESAMIFLIIIYHPIVLLLMIFLKWLYLKIF